MSFFEKFQGFARDQPDVEVDSNNGRDEMGVLFNKDDQFAAAFATIGGLNYDLFFDFLRCYEYVEKLDLQKQMHSAMKDPSGYWRVVESFVRRDPEEIFDVLNGTSNLGKSNGFKAVGVELYNTGTSKIELRDDEDWIKEDCSQELKAILKNADMVKASAVLEKKNAIANAVKALTDVLPMAHAPGNNASARYDKALEIIESFDQGKFNLDLHKNVKFPKECGVGLPHTMSSKRWLVQALTNLFSAIADCPAGIAIRSSSITDVSRVSFDSNDPIYFSDDEESPYSLDYHPSWLIDGDSTQSWSWRTTVDNMMKRVNLELSESSSIDRDVALSQALREHLKSNYDSLEFRSFKFKYMFARDNIPYFKFYSDGLSTVEKVYECPDFLHVVSVNVVSQIPDSEYVKVVLPDFNSVVLIPFDFCAVMQLGEFKISSGFTITASDDLSSMRNLALCYQLSHTFAFIESLSGGSPYQYREHAEKLEAMIGSKGANRSLFLRGTSRDARVSAFRGLSNLFVGGNFGLVICAERSKIGGRTTKELNKNSAFIKLTDESRNFGRKSGGKGFAQVFLRDKRKEEESSRSSSDLDESHEERDENENDQITDDDMKEFMQDFYDDDI